MIETYGNPIGGGTNIKTLPMQISNLAATAGTDGIAGYIDVSFNEPPATSWDLVKNYIIVYKEGSIPTSPFDGYRVIADKVAASGKIEKRISGLTFDQLYGIRIFPFSVDNKYQTAVTGSTATATPVAGIRLDSLMAGTEVDKIKGIENDPEVQFLVLKHNYENSGGTLCLRENVKNSQIWDNSENRYGVSDITSYCNNYGINILNKKAKQNIDSVKAKYYFAYGGSDSRTMNDISNNNNRAFLLSVTELGLTHANARKEGSQISYFNSDKKRIVYGNKSYWLRSPYITDRGNLAFFINTLGKLGYDNVYREHSFRPAIVLDSNMLFNTQPDADGCYVPI